MHACLSTCVRFPGYTFLLHYQKVTQFLSKKKVQEKNSPLILTVTINIFASCCTVFNFPPYVVEFILHVMHIPGVLSISLIWLYRESFLQSPTVRHTFFPQYLAIINNIVMNIYPKKSCFRPFLIISLRYITRRRVLNQRDMHFLKTGREGCQVLFSRTLTTGDFLPVASRDYLALVLFSLVESQASSVPVVAPWLCSHRLGIQGPTTAGLTAPLDSQEQCDKASPGHWQAHLLFIS